MMAGLGAGLAMAPTAAYAAVAAQEIRNPALRQLAQSSLVTGRTPSGTQRYQALPPAVRDKLSVLPDSLRRTYVDLDVPARRWLAGKVNGKTATLFGDVNNRKAFVRGKVANVFGALQDRLHAEIRAGRIPQSAKPRLDSLIAELRNLSPQQRAALADALQAEFPPAKA